MPVVAYFADATLAQALESDAERAGAAFDLSQWLRSRLPLPEPAPQELIDACGRASDRAALRKELSLDYERFNRALLALDESPLSNEAELRSMYDAYVRRMGARILERLRRRTTVREEPRFTRDYLDPARRAIGNRVQVRFKDGSETPPVEVAYPLGHPRRRAEALPLLRAKFAASVADRFTSAGAAAIERLWDDPEHTDRLRVDQLVDCFTTKMADRSDSVR